MAGAVAHHFNNLLGAVIGHLELAVDNLSSASEAMPSIQESLDTAHRAAGISQLMLAYLGQTMKKKEPIDLAQAIRETLDINRVLVPPNIDLKTGLMDSGPAILGNTAHLKQIVTNLITNSVEAIGEAAGHITIAADVVDAKNISQSNLAPVDWKPEAGAYACLSVADSGPGLNAETREKIFDPFFTTKFTGRGMGLPVVIGLMRFHKGAVAVESSPGDGAVFRLYFPISEGTAPVSEKKPCSVSRARSSGVVLLVEDEVMVRNMVRIMLERLGHEVMTACDGIEAVEVFTSNRERVKCVLLDITMPRMGGLETISALRAIQPDLPIILCSGYMDAPEMAAKHGHIPQAFLNKPYGKKDLESVLARVLVSR
jgi:CheY-like chemotaxis protein